MGEGKITSPTMPGGSGITVELSESLSVRRANGDLIEFSQRRSEALLALLALAPKLRRTRSWLRDRLWASREQKQQMDSLRQCLLDVRKALGADKDALESSRFDIWFNPDRVTVVIAEDAGSALLEDFSLPHTPEFWSEIHTVRQPVLAAPTHSIVPVQPVAHVGPVVVIQPSVTKSDDADDFAFCSILDSIAVTLNDFGVAKVIDARYAPTDFQALNGVSLETRLHQDERGLHCRFVMHRLATGELMWSATHTCPASAIEPQADYRMLNIVNAIVWRIAGSLKPRRAEDAQVEAAGRELATGIEMLFRLGADNLLAADQCFARAFELEPRGLFLAWRAYVRTYLIAEMLAPCRLSCIEEALAMKARALEMEPANSQALALAAHVEIITRRSYVAAYELSERSVELNAANPLAWSTLGIAKCHLGDAIGGFENAQFARRIAGIAPYRFHIDTLACLASVMSNKLGTALQNAEAAHVLAPDFKPPLRYMAAIHRKQRDEHSMETSVSRLRRLEPDFSFYKLSDTSYPSAALRRAGLL